MTVSKNLLSELLPGPVTVVMKRSEELNPDLNPGASLVGIRIPDHTFVRSCAMSCDEPLLLTSANRSSAPSTVDIQVSIVFIYYNAEVFKPFSNCTPWRKYLVEGHPLSKQILVCFQAFLLKSV